MLAYKQEPQITGASGKTPEMMLRINAFVAGESFTPPPVPAKLGSTGLKWHTGQFLKKKNSFWLGDAEIMGGRDMKVLVIKVATPDSFAKKQGVLWDSGWFNFRLQPENPIVHPVVEFDSEALKKAHLTSS